MTPFPRENEIELGILLYGLPEPAHPAMIRAAVSLPGLARACSPSSRALSFIAAPSSPPPRTFRNDAVSPSTVQSGADALLPQTPNPPYSAKVAKSYVSSHAGRMICGTPALPSC